MHSGNDIRAAFLDYFRRHDHEIVGSAPLVPRNDPTLLFTNAGMVPFKSVFTGAETRSYTRAASSQKCVRAGGKHNDLENVGATARHHTFFEMLGNFSFGDYFKEAAIKLAWNLLTREFEIDPARLFVTVYVDDDEAFELWRKIANLPESRIYRNPTADNFWAMGESGPCGPCTEIFYDHGEHIPGGPPGSDQAEGDRFVEIWNLVFMQYDQVAKGERLALPKPCVDTGMGLERISAVLQGTHDNYDTDLLRGLIEASAEATKTSADGEHAVSHRVIADHLRSVSFLIADGVMPANEGRGYVLRRIMRRAMRHAHLIGCTEPLLHRLVPNLVRKMSGAYPELVRGEALIEETLKLEEARFTRTLGRGLKLLAEETAKLAPGAPLAGDVAFRLYDTYGFPLDLTQDALRAKGIEVEVGGFDAAMARQRADARAAWAGSGEATTETLWFDVRERVGVTEFLGYETEVAEGRIVALVVGGEEVKSAAAGTLAAVVTNQTPFYGESGGQVGDTGVLFSANGNSFTVRDTKKVLADLIMHEGEVERGTLRVGDIVEMRIDEGRRAAVRANHSATHLLHQALRRQLGAHVAQKGSMVAPERLRFDFSHTQAISEPALRDIEAEVNRLVRENATVTTRIMTPDEATQAGAIALFGEKYGDEVRVVAMGKDPQSESGAFSVELCGGTHVRRTGDIGLIKIVSETALASGVRRIEAMSGGAALGLVKEREEILGRTAAVLKTAPAEVPERVAALLEERKRLERELVETRRALASGDSEGAGEEEIAGIKFIARTLENVPPKELKPMVDDLKQRIGSGVVALASVTESKASLVVGVTDDLMERFSAIDFVRAGVAELGGKGGGGRADMAQGGGPDASRTAAAIKAIEKAITEAA
jgi:alanyl-tRNA synthetase